jgi:hypothetical protein
LSGIFLGRVDEIVSKSTVERIKSLTDQVHIQTVGYLFTRKFLEKALFCRLGGCQETSKLYCFSLAVFQKLLALMNFVENFSFSSWLHQ